MRSLRQIRSLAGGAVLLLIMTATPVLGDAEDHGEQAAPLAMRVFNVGALTMGRLWFLGERPPPSVSDNVFDIESPLFGAEGAGPIYPVGEVKELIELLKSSVHPLTWETIEGAQVHGRNERTLEIRNRPDVLDDVARWLARLEQQVLQTALIEVRTRRVAKGSPRGPSLSLAAFVNQRISGFRGSQYSHLSDYDVEVDKGSKISDPIVVVSNVGLGVDALLLPGDPTGKLMLDIAVRMSALEDERRVAAGEQRTIEVPRLAATRLQAVVGVTPGRWTPLPGGGDERGWRFEVRVILPATALPTSARGPYPLLAPPAGEYEGVPPVRMYELHDLLATPRPKREEFRHLELLTPRSGPSPEVPEPMPLFPVDELISFVHDVSAPGTWDDPMSIEARDGRLLARNRPETLSAIAALLARIRRDTLWSVTARLEVIEMPGPLLDGLLPGPDGVLVLSAAQRGRLDALVAGGTARRLSRMDVSCSDRVPNAISSGSHVPYLQEYVVEIAENSAISNPVIQSFFSGLSLEVTAARTTGGKHVAMEVRATRSTHVTPLRRVDTPLGPMECPTLEVFRVRTGLLVPLESSVLLAVEGDGDARRVMLLTPTVPHRR